MSIHFVPCSASATSSDASFLALPLVTASPESALDERSHRRAALEASLREVLF
ncbi:hypothetical protein ACSBR2_015602 [Camellia fascicularis]